MWLRWGTSLAEVWPDTEPSRRAALRCWAQWSLVAPGGGGGDGKAREGAEVTYPLGAVALAGGGCGLAGDRDAVAAESHGIGGILVQRKATPPAKSCIRGLGTNRSG